MDYKIYVWIIDAYYNITAVARNITMAKLAVLNNKYNDGHYDLIKNLEPDEIHDLPYAEINDFR